MMHFLAVYDPTDWLNSLQGLNAETDLTMLTAELLWFGGGTFAAFLFCGVCTIIRASKGAYGATDI